MTVNSVTNQAIALLEPLVPASITTLARKDEAPLAVKPELQPLVLVGLAGDENEEALTGEQHGVNLATWTLGIQVWKTYNADPAGSHTGADFMTLIKTIEDVFRQNRTLGGGADVPGQTQVNLVSVNRKRQAGIDPYITAGKGQHTRYRQLAVQIQEYVLT